jgi:hypothetical protein
MMEIHGVKLPKVLTNVRLNTIAEKAPMTIKPSSPIFTTPDRSEKIPPNAVKISGAAHNNVDGTTIIKISIKLNLLHLLLA